ncbi:MAG TPA: hypothetical protein DD417_17890 [Elusimicrobia bacterium]|nr:hypothetical protein [Candidatus Rokubacteria bacterium]HBL18573.1 hypothetical protein [Elusimicrobiota bacterium]
MDGLLVGVDTGGTFTDFVLLEERSGQVFNFKLPSTPKDPGGALVEGLGGRWRSVDSSVGGSLLFATNFSALLTPPRRRTRGRGAGGVGPRRP